MPDTGRSSNGDSSESEGLRRSQRRYAALFTLFASPVTQITLNARPLGVDKTNMDIQQVSNVIEEVERKVEEIKCLLSHPVSRSKKKLNLLIRGTNKTRHPPMVFSAGSIHKLQHCVRGPPGGNGRVVLSRHEIQGLDVDRSSPMDPWKT